MTTAHLLSTLPVLRSSRSQRASSWDRSGGNKDNVTLLPNTTHTMAEIDGAGCITHIWVTIASPDRFHFRSLVLRMYWDGEESPSVEVPIGDFFGIGNCQSRNFQSLLLARGPRDGRALNCYIPMPFKTGARIDIHNDSDLPCIAFYYYVDYEAYDAPPDDIDERGRFHAWWNREAPCEKVVHPKDTERFGFRGFNLTGDDNYLILEAEGRGHYIGCNLNIYNSAGGWYGEGDDMIFIDGESFPPSLHGTGTEDYFNTAWSPAETFDGPFFGQPIAERSNWKGFSTVYRWHVADPINFQTSIRVTIEHGHANDRGDDYSSTAYWYQTEPHKTLRPLPPREERLPPYPEDRMALELRANEVLAKLAAGMTTDIIPDDKDTLNRFVRGLLLYTQLEELFTKNDLKGVERVLDMTKI